MSYRLSLLLVAVLVVTGAAWTAGEAIGSQVVCQGNACGGPGPSQYLYQVTAPGSTSFNHWQLGVHDLNAANYINWVLPPGWVSGLAPLSVFQDDGFTAHGAISTPTGMCPGHIDFSGPAITSGVFGFDHWGAPHDVGWRVDCLGVACPIPPFWVEDWTQPVGLGPGPVHAPVAVPQPPVCCFTYAPASPSAGATVQFTDCSTDPDDLIIGWAWSFGDGGTSIQQNPTHVFAAGVYIVLLTVTDQAGNTTTCGTTVTVSGPYCQVVCNGNVCGNPIGPTRFRYELTAAPGYTFDRWRLGTFDPTLINYTNWMVPGGWSYTITSPGTLATRPAATPHTMFSLATGTAPYEIVFAGPAIGAGVFGFDNPAALNDMGWQVQDTTAPWQYNENWLSPVGTGHGPVHAPGFSNFWPPMCQFTYSPAAPTDQTPVQFTDTSYDLNNQIVAWSWNFGDGGSSTLQNPSHQYAAGTYTVSLTVTDNGIPPLSSTCSQTITVTRSNLAPVARFTYVPLRNWDSATPVQFTDMSYDPDGVITSWAWDFQSDGIVDSTVPNPTFLFPPGAYSVSLVVTDNGTPPLSGWAVTPLLPVAGPFAQVFCYDLGTCPSTGPWRYQYWATAPTGGMFNQVVVGTDDPNPANYTNWVLPVGWWWWIGGPWQVPHDPCTPHGIVSPTTGQCPYTLFFMGPPIPSGRFEFTHPSPPHDVGWRVDDAFGPAWWVENWALPLGLGQGPVHGPGTPVNLPPICNPSVDCSGCVAGVPMQFHANAVDPEGGPMGYEWDFGDGNIGEPGSDPFHEFVYSDTYNVCVTVTDDQGASTECCMRVGVGPGEQLCFTLKGNCWHMITLPCYPVDPDPAVVFEELLPPNKPDDYLSGQLHRYDNEEQRYATYYSFFPSDFGPIEPGVGYWLWLFEDETICYEAVCSGDVEEVHFPYEGWHMMGSPQPVDTYIDCVLFRRGAPLWQRFSEIMNLWVQDPLIGYRCDPPPSGYDSMGLLGTDDDDHLRAFKGYWMYAFQPAITMAVPPPGPCCPPVCCFEYFPPDPVSESPVQFTDCSWDPDGGIIAWEWDFGDGGTSTDQNPIHLFECGTYEVCLTVTDEDGACPPGAGNGTCCQVVTVADVTPPEITCPPPVTVCNDGGTCGAHDIDIGSTIIADACDPDPVVTNDKPEYFPVGTTTVTWTACDESGNCSSCGQLVTVVDCEPPTFECPPDMTVVSPDCGIVGISHDEFLPYLLGATDNCAEVGSYDGDPDVDCDWDILGSGHYDTKGSPRYCKKFNLWVHWQGGSIDASIDLIDGLTPVSGPGTGPPDITGQPDLPAKPDCTWEVAGFWIHGWELRLLWIHWQGGVVDQSQWMEAGEKPSTQAADPVIGIEVGPGINQIEWTVCDQADNCRSCIQTITVDCPPVCCFSYDPPEPDDQAPVQFTDCSYDPDGEIVAWEWQFGDGDMGVEPSPFHWYECGTYDVCLTVTDDEGYTDTCCQVMTVLDVTPPVVTPPPDITLETDPGACEACDPDIGTATATDNCDPDPVITNDAPTCFEEGVYVDVICTACDDAGNCASAQYTVFTIDREPPTVDFPVERTVESEDCAPIEIELVELSLVGQDPITVTDNCPLPEEEVKADCTWEKQGSRIKWGGIWYDLWQHWLAGEIDMYDWLPEGEEPGGGADPLTHIVLDPGVNPVDWGFCDPAGNCSYGTQIITVECPPQCCFTFDPPVAECGLPVDFVDCSTDPDGTVVDWLWDFGDGGTSTAQNATHVYIAEHVGNDLLVCLTVTDDDGLTATCCQVVTVADTTPPEITCAGELVVCNDPGTCTASGIDLPMPIVTDNCDPDPVIITYGAPPDNIFVVGTTTVTRTACDDAGNCSSCDQLVTVEVCLPPLECTGDMTVLSPDCGPLELDWELFSEPAQGAAVPRCPPPPDCTWLKGNLRVWDGSRWLYQWAHFTGGGVDEGLWLPEGEEPGGGTPVAGLPVEPGPNEIVWELCDDGGDCSSCTQTVTVNCPPVADPNGPYEVHVGEPITLDGSGSYDPDPPPDSIVAWEWDLNGDGVYGERVGPMVPLDWPEIELEVFGGICVLEEPRPIALRVTDSYGAIGEGTVTITVRTRWPVPDPDGPYPVPLGGGVTLDGSGSADPDEGCGDSIVEWSWDINGDGLYGDRTGETVPLSWPEIELEVCGGSCLPGSPYPVALRVTDSYGAVGEATTTLTVINSPPVADPNGPYMGHVGEPITLDGSGSYDPDAPLDSIVAWDWDINGDGLYGDRTGPVVPMDWPEIELEVFGGVCVLDEPRPIALRVTDSYGVTDIATTTLTVLDSPPVADANGPYEFECGPGSTLELDGSGSYDPDEACGDSIIAWEWDINGDGVYGDRSGETVLLTWPEIESELCGGACEMGTDYVIGLQVISDYGHVASDDMVQGTLMHELGHAITTGPYQVAHGEGVTLDGSASYHPDEPCGVSIVAYEWDLDNDGQYDDGTGAIVPLTWEEILADFFAGVCVLEDPRPIALQITDSEGLTSIGLTTLTVIDSPPIADPNGPYEMECGEGLTLDGSGSFDPDMGCGDSIVAWEWDINGDGLYGDRTGETVPMTWPEIETEICGGMCDLGTPRPIALRVTDEFGMTSTAATTLYFYTSEPIADPNGPYEVPVGGGLTLDGSGSVDPDMGCGDSIVAWEWDINGDGLYGDRIGEMVPLTWLEIELEVCGGSCLAGIPYPVALRVTDSYGASGEAATTVTVNLPACEVICNGTVCGGAGPSPYQYVIAASPGLTLDYVEVGTHDPDLGNYLIWELPPGWTLDILPMEHLDNGFDPHGAAAAPTGMCPFSMVFMGPPMASMVIGFDHVSPPHDVGWLVEPLGCAEDWALPVGMGGGPVHAPGAGPP